MKKVMDFRKFSDFRLFVLSSEFDDHSLTLMHFISDHFFFFLAALSLQK